MAGPSPRRSIRRRSSLFARGEGAVWLSGGALVLCVVMIAGLLALVIIQGGKTFWPSEIVRLDLGDGSFVLGEVHEEDVLAPDPDTLAAMSPEARAELSAHLEQHDGGLHRRMLRTGNRTPEIREEFTLVTALDVTAESIPEWALVVERSEWGPAYGLLRAFEVGGTRIAQTPASAWDLFKRHHDDVREGVEQVRELQLEVGALDKALEELRLDARGAAADHGEDSPAHRVALEALRTAEQEQGGLRTSLSERIRRQREENERYVLILHTGRVGVAERELGEAAHEGTDPLELQVPLSQIVRAFAPNRIGFLGRLGVYASRWWEFLSDNPREANKEGGVYPAIFGTIAMTLLMTLLVVPFGVLGALYLREVARQGLVVSIVRIAVNNLAGVPSIVFGVFGLGFFCYIVGANIDELFFSEHLPNPTFGKGGLLWASLTLALLTLPVVVVSTEEALAAVPNSMREGSYACGASRWQTIRRIVLPRAMPGIMTGMILAIARGAGEVAPLMLTGAAKVAESLPVDGTAPFLHPERSFMHLGFHIYDLGFQTENAKAAEPMVYTTTLLLIAIVVLLNVLAIWMRGRLRRAYSEL